MNGTVVFGVALIIVGLFFTMPGPGMLPLLLGGVAVIFYGAFAPPKINRRPRRAADEDQFV